MDALRFALADYTHQGRAINMSISRVVAVRHFCNKIWNASRFVMSQLEPGSTSLPEVPHSATLRLPEQWLLSRLDTTVQVLEGAFETLQLHKATAAFHTFFLYDFCDAYIEWSKLSLRSPDKVPEFTLGF
jgi:valyl-tRNA synthetase